LILRLLILTEAICKFSNHLSHFAEKKEQIAVMVRIFTIVPLR